MRKVQLLLLLLNPFVVPKKKSVCVCVYICINDTSPWRLVQVEADIESGLMVPPRALTLK